MIQYEFKCPDCKHIWSEYRDKEGDTTSADCPRCGSAAHRKFSLAGHFNEAAGFKEDYYIAFGKHIRNKKEFKAAMREAQIENEEFTYEDMDIETGDSTGEMVTNYRPCELEANVL